MIFSIYGFFVPEGHMIVARRFIAGPGPPGPRPGGTPECRRDVPAKGQARF
jgi:hypothetical protein